jgi:hypothetical protein
MRWRDGSMRPNPGPKRRRRVPCASSFTPRAWMTRPRSPPSIPRAWSG